jgi:hypothetical protein
VNSVASALRMPSNPKLFYVPFTIFWIVAPFILSYAIVAPYVIVYEDGAGDTGSGISMFVSLIFLVGLFAVSYLPSLGLLKSYKYPSRVSLFYWNGKRQRASILWSLACSAFIILYGYLIYSLWVGPLASPVSIFVLFILGYLALMVRAILISQPMSSSTDS